MDCVGIGGKSAGSDDSVDVEVSVYGAAPPEVNWLLILAALLAGASATYAATT